MPASRVVSYTFLSNARFVLQVVVAAALAVAYVAIAAGFLSFIAPADAALVTLICIVIGCVGAAAFFAVGDQIRRYHLG